MCGFGLVVGFRSYDSPSLLSRSLSDISSFGEVVVVRSIFGFKLLFVGGDGGQRLEGSSV